MSKQLFATRSWVESIALTNSTPLLKTVTTSQLSELINDSSLVPGYIYRLTDYVCVPANPNTQASAGHQFDILFLAISTNKLHKRCCADHHEGDSYFSNSDLSKWDLDVHFDASTGVATIIRMCDEFENECFFDFKNLKSTLTIAGTTDLFYHFRSSSGGDDTLSGNSHHNKVGRNSIDFSAGPGNYLIRVGDNCKGWVTNSNCFNWVCEDNCSGWKTGSNCQYWTAKKGSSSWSTGNSCSYWVSGEGGNSWSSGDNCSGWTTGVYCYGWIAGSDCSSWRIGNSCHSWKCGSFCSAFDAGNGSSDWEIGSNVSGWSCGEYCFGWKTLDTQDTVTGDFSSFKIEAGNSNFDIIHPALSGSVKNFTIGFGTSASLSSTMPRAKVVFTEVEQNHHTLVVPFNSITLQV